MGQYAGNYNTTGCYNIAIGQYAGEGSVSGSWGCDNVFIGRNAGSCIRTGSNNIFLGYAAGADASGLAIITTESNRIIVGNSSHTCAQIQVGWTTVSDIRDKIIFGPVSHGKEFLRRITPITFSFKDRNTGEATENRKRYGFSAQNILELEGDDPVIVSKEMPEKLQMTNDHLIPILVNAINQMSDEMDVLRGRLEALEKK